MEAALKVRFEAQSNTGRPILTSLNGDNSWLFSFPRPAKERAETGKIYYHVVFEPWLKGTTNQLHPWLIHISLGAPPAATDAESVVAIANTIEAVAARSLGVTLEKKKDDLGVDAILLGLHYLDHLHEPTLALFDKRIPVIATPEAAAKVKAMNHFDTIATHSDFPLSATNWRDPDLHPGHEIIPSWLTPLRLAGKDDLHYCTALIWTHTNKDSTEEEIHELILQTPHGINLDVDAAPLDAFLAASPSTKNLALLHGLKEAFAAGSINTYGAVGGLKLFRRIGGAEYWIPSHGSALVYTGFIMRMLYVHDTPRTLLYALEKEGKEEQELVKPNLVQVENGGFAVLA